MVNNEEKIAEKVSEFENFYSSLAVDTCKLYLYRVVNGTTKYLSKYDYLPEVDEVAETFGGGTYQLTLKYKDVDCTWKTKTQTIHIDSAICSPMQQTGGGDSILIVEKLLAALTPLLKPAINNSNVELQNEMVNKMMMSNFQAQQKMFSMIAQQQQQQTFDDDDDEIDDTPQQNNFPAWLQALAPLIDEYLPDLLGDGVASKMLVGLIKKNKDFKEIQQDDTKAKILIEYMTKQIGEEKTAAVLNKLFPNE